MDILSQKRSPQCHHFFERLLFMFSIVAPLWLDIGLETLVPQPTTGALAIPPDRKDLCVIETSTLQSLEGVAMIYFVGCHG